MSLQEKPDCGQQPLEAIDGAYLAAKLNLRCIEDGDCLMWQGAANARGPVLTVAQKQYSLRRLVWEQKNGKPFPVGRVASVTCGRKNCLEHLSALTRGVLNAMSNRRGSATRGPKIAKTMRAKSKLSQEAVRSIRDDDRPMKVIAAEHQISAEYGYMLRRGDFRKEYSTPFSGLERS